MERGEGVVEGRGGGRLFLCFGVVPYFPMAQVGFEMAWSHGGEGRGGGMEAGGGEGGNGRVKGGGEREGL